MSKSKSTVAVIIPTYNRAKLLVQALDSILSQTRPPDEVVVVDDGSTDATAEVLHGYGDRIRYLHQANAGKPAALNRAMATLSADYVWIMDDDDVALSDALERHLAYFHAHPEVDFTYSGVYCFKGTEMPPPPAECLLWQRQDIAHTEFFIRAMELFPCNQQTMLVPLACYRAVGPYDEKQTFAEDYEMILRLARSYCAGRIEEPTILLRQHTGARGPAHERQAAAERWNAWRPYERNIFIRLRKSLPLTEYLPRGASAECLTQADTRRALLQRACIMTHHWLFAEALEDLDAATAISEDAAFTREERLICSRMLSVEPDVLAGQADFVRAVARLLGKRAPSLFESAAAGMSWSLMRELRAGNRAGAAQMGVHLLRLTGPAGLAGIFGKKLTRRLHRKVA
jgi:hypothetical protein